MWLLCLQLYLENYYRGSRNDTFFHLFKYWENERNEFCFGGLYYVELRLNMLSL